MSFQLCLNEFPETLQLALKPQARKIIEDIKNGYTGIHPDLFNAYYNNLRKAPERVLQSPNYGDKYFDMQAQFEANIARFAAYKAYHTTRQIDAKRADKKGVVQPFEVYQKEAQRVLNAFNRYQVTEYNTAVARARTAKQWTEFTQDEYANELFPYIMWLPSRSVTKREEHIVFYNKYWAKDSDFWTHNQPGNLWNCKCDWQETDGNTGTPGADTYRRVGHKGLDGNPAITGEIFSESATYFQSQDKQVKASISELQRRLAKEKLEILRCTSVSVDIMNKKQDIIFDGITKSHISNDIRGSKNWLFTETITKYPDLIKNSKLVASEDNTKLDKKPWALKYYYFECKIGKKTFYFNIEENNNLIEHKHFFRLYSITSNLRESAIRI